MSNNDITHTIVGVVYIMYSTVGRIMLYLQCLMSFSSASRRVHVRAATAGGVQPVAAELHYDPIVVLLDLLVYIQHYHGISSKQVLYLSDTTPGAQCKNQKTANTHTRRLPPNNSITRPNTTQPTLCFSNVRFMFNSFSCNVYVPPICGNLSLHQCC